MAMGEMEVDGAAKRRGNVWNRTQQVCTFWLQGRCNRNPCNFLHAGDPTGGSGQTSVMNMNGNSKRSGLFTDGGRSSIGGGRWGKSRRSSDGTHKISTKPCLYFLRNTCTRGDLCKFLHAHSTTTDMAFIAQLTGHEKAVRAITLPENTNTLYTGGQDETIRIWDCATGQCTKIIPMGKDIGCLLSESGWIFIGLPDEVKAWNLQNNSEQCLTGPNGQVHALAIYNDMLMAGIQDGSILVWKYNLSTDMFEPVASLLGHKGPVVTLEVAGERLYSGSMDKSIKVWDLNTGHLIQTLEEHTHVVMSLISWEQYLLSCSLDGTLKVWGVAENGAFEVQYTYPEDIRRNDVLDGALSLCGFKDPQGRSILLCSYNDNTIRLFDLPSFTETGILFSKEEVRTLHIGPKGLIFSGDSSGEVKVWKWAFPAAAAP